MISSAKRAAVSIEFCCKEARLPLCDHAVRLQLPFIPGVTMLILLDAMKINGSLPSRPGSGFTRETENHVCQCVNMVHVDNFKRDSYMHAKHVAVSG